MWTDVTNITGEREACRHAHNIFLKRIAQQEQVIYIEQFTT